MLVWPSKGLLTQTYQSFPCSSASEFLQFLSSLVYQNPVNIWTSLTAAWHCLSLLDGKGCYRLWKTPISKLSLPFLCHSWLPWKWLRWLIVESSHREPKNLCEINILFSCKWFLVIMRQGRRWGKETWHCQHRYCYSKWHPVWSIRCWHSIKKSSSPPPPCTIQVGEYFLSISSLLQDK